MGSTADIDPRDDLFFRETLKGLGGELARHGSQMLEQGRITSKLTGVIELLTDTTKELTGAVRDLTAELVHHRSGDRRRPSTASPPIILPRTKTGG